MSEITWSVKGALNVLLQSFSSTSIWTSKVEHIVSFTAIFSNICTAHPQKRLFIHFRCKILTPPFDSPTTKFRRFGDVFRWLLHFICRISAIFLLPVCLTYWPRKYTTRVDPHVDNSHKVWRPFADPFLNYEWQRFPSVAIENAYAATAHAPNNMTRK